MRRYGYRLRRVCGKTQYGIILAQNENDARHQLMKEKAVLLTLMAMPTANVTILTMGNRQMAHKFIKQLSLMVGAALPLKESLQLILQQPASPHSRAVIASLYQQICQGVPLSIAMREHPKWFNDLCCSIVEAGEWGGTLGVSLNNYAEHLDEQYKLHRAVRQALSYPLLLLSVSFLVTGVLLTVAVPQIVSQLSVSGMVLPWSTRLVLGAGEFLRHHWFAFFAGLLAMMMMVTLLIRHDNVRLHIHKAVLRLPVVGNLLFQIQQVRLLMTLAILSDASVPVADALRLSAYALNNRFMRFKVIQATQRVIEGVGVSRALEHEKVLSEETLALLAAGELGGRSGDVLIYLANMERDNLQQRLLGGVKLLEPILIFILGLVVLLVFMAIIQPMLAMNSLSF